VEQLSEEYDGSSASIQEAKMNEDRDTYKVANKRTFSFRHYLRNEIAKLD
jgi:hypothetical protein